MKIVPTDVYVPSDRGAAGRVGVDYAEYLWGVVGCARVC